MNTTPEETVTDRTLLIAGPAIAAYGFPNGHPFGPDRHDAFMTELERSPVFGDLEIVQPQVASRELLELFHTSRYIDFVREMSALGHGFLDNGDTPVFSGVYEAAATVVGGTITALDRIMTGEARRAFIPIGGLHHARRDGAAGFCVFNDCGIAIERARRDYGVERVAYVDIDAHHGDGVFYGFEDDPSVIVADVHEDGRYLYPGTGRRDETGRGEAAGTKLNIPLPPGAGDAEFLAAWEETEAHLERYEPALYLLQCGADSVAGDPITHLEFSVEAHAHAATRLKALAERTASGRLLAMGGGGYNRNNLARCWTRVVESLS
ncbi:MAG TPA: acetoin utilization protein AcuC [Gammaproteobacteria bacterium]|nr:acetoin utilization protein AcuC [Gammaproteobacteria bacterium]